MSACWPLQMPPTAKAVLVCMADFAGDDGECWPSIPTVALRTCFSERAVQNAIHWLEASGVVVADRSNGRHTRYLVAPNRFQPPQQVHPRSKCTGAPRSETPAAGAGDPSTSCTPPPQQVPSNRKEPSRTVRATTKAPVDLPAWLPVDSWRDWCEHRKASKNPMTPKAAELSIEKLAEFREQGFSPARVINNAIERGWRGLYVTGLVSDLKNNPTGKPSAAADFRGKTYDATPIDDLPADLRAAALAAIGGNG